MSTDAGSAATAGPSAPGPSAPGPVAATAGPAASVGTGSAGTGSAGTTLVSGVARASTRGGLLARLGFSDPARAERLLADPALAGLLDPLEDRFADGVLSALSETADPDLALLGLVRMLEGLGRAPSGPGAPDPGPEDDAPDADPRGCQPARLRAVLRSGGHARDRLLAVLGASAALGDHLARHPGHWTALVDDGHLAPDPDEVRADLLRSIGADPDDPRPAATDPVAATDALRIAYRRRLLAIAGRDLVADDPAAVLPDVAQELSDLAAAALEAGLAIARAELPPGAPGCRIAVVGMGKCGGRELNYVSDVDVIYVVEPDDGEEAAALDTGARLAAGMARACSAVTVEGTLWPVDAALRPEGKAGPLVRTLDSHLSYYHRWAQTWEFQALLKARPVAGDRELGERYLEAIRPLVWRAAERDNFVEDVQAMRRRVEQTLPAKEADRQLKLGAGGLRDVEFSVQLLQLVHGRADARLRTGNTLLGLESLSTFGYVGRDDAAELDRAYRMLRTLEHRIQLYRLRRTHVVPDAAADLRRLGRSFGFRRDPAGELEELWRRHAREVRRLHEKLFYRPLLAAAARLTTDEARLTPEAARARLAALGYRDPAGAMRHLTALTAGVSRRAAIQRQLLPVMLGWFADGADPDAGLLAFRRVSDELGTTHWYLKMLRDSGAAAERMAHVLSASRLVAELLERGPEAVALLGDDTDLAPRPRTATLAAVRRAADRHAGDPEGAALAARAVRRREIVRTAIADIVGLADLDQVGLALSDAAAAALDGVLRAAGAMVASRFGGTLPTRVLVVAMGRLGGSELGYSSDADVLFVHDPLPGAEDKPAQDAAMAVFTELRRLLGEPGPEPALDVDADLRPEGRNGPLVRTLDSYAQYYARWSSPWEAQALTRAVPIAGDPGLAERFVAVIDPVRWPAGGLPEAAVREIRRIKARVEAERIPRGADRALHLKLGPGGLSDVEWTVQLLQLQHAHELPELRTPSTTAALEAAARAGVLAEPDAQVLLAAWRLASRARNASVLWRGRAQDALPTSIQDLDGVSRIVGYPPGSAVRLDEDYQRTTRRARAVVRRVFYG
ncbi:MAG TPA: bifunctional [glutamine synthetase] adenylyltransferase/[glutamine synthetase]-adenylyl-L-tyrosine phosphorylase [Kineosporiaceae bacterium]|nr:bifunctional [glutamine synthetase] adenylyltransferase/[glutamine synthetase]-adenylyl-L-tyrosine phosphorylase [Kineosporiaceae bacterium]